MSLQNTIIFIGQTPTAGGTGGYIYTVNPDGTGVTQLSAAGSGWLYAVASADGLKILAMKNVLGSFEIFLLAEDGSGASRITNMHPNAQTSVPPSFSPDGSQFVLPYGEPSASSAPAGACIVNIDNSGYHSFALATIGAGNSNAAIYWSPDGSKLAFPDTSGASGYGVSTCNAADGTGVVAVADDSSNWYDVFGWFSDSTNLLIQGMSTSSGNPITIRKTSTVLYTDPTQTYFNGSVMGLSSDGSTVVFFTPIVGMSGESTLNSLDLASGTITPLISPPPYPVGGIDTGGGSYMVQWIDPAPAVSKIAAGPHTIGLIRIA